MRRSAVIGLAAMCVLAGCGSERPVSTAVTDAEHRAAGHPERWSDPVVKELGD